ncbi:hypothetical protein MMC18_007096 [Xylographa bjoerkii]|nr:hypothetical protein [Xylographa bjoerkii]
MAPIKYKAAQIASSPWDPYKVLDIYHNNGRTLSCVGTAKTQWGSRCRWQFFSDASLPIHAYLDAMAACDPGVISRKQLEALAKLCLCPDNHQYQAAEKAEEWYEKISEILNKRDETAALIENVDRLKMLLQNAVDDNKKLQQRTEGALEAERAARSIEVERLNRQLRNVQTDFEKHRVEKAAELDGLRNRLQANSTLLEEARVTDAKRVRDVDELKDQLEQSSTYTETAKQATEKEIDRLKAELEASSTILSKAQTKASSRIDDLRRRLKVSDERLEEQKRTSSQVTDNLDQQLKDSNKQLDTLRTANLKDTMELDRLRRQLQDLSDEYTNNKTVSSSRISDLQQQNHILKARKYFNAFRTQVKLITKQKQIEQAESTNAALFKQSERLMERIGDMDGQLAEQNVRFRRSIVGVRAPANFSF